MAQKDFWQGNQLATKVVNELKILKSKLEPFCALSSRLKDFRELLEITSPDDSSSISELSKDQGLLLEDLDALEFKFFLWNLSFF